MSGYIMIFVPVFTMALIILAVSKFAQKKKLSSMNKPSEKNQSSDK